MKQKVYSDTSVIGGCFDDEFSQWSRLLIDEFRSGIKIAVVSDLTLEELEIAPEKIKAIVSDLPVSSIEYAFLS